MEELEIIEFEIEQQLQKLYSLKNHKDNEVRLSVCSLLGNFFLKYINDNEKVLLNYLNDADELVQVESLEILGAFGDARYAENIVKLFNNKSWLVRASAYEAIADIGEIKYLKNIKKRLNSVQNMEEKIRLYYSLVKLGEQKYMKELLLSLKDENYRVRCATSNLLFFLFNDNNKKEILKTLRNALKIEKTVAVKSCISDVLKDLEIQ